MAQLLIQSYLRETASMAFVPGHSDCLMWVEGLVWEVTGHRLARVERGSYEDMRAGLRMLRNKGGLERVMARRLAGVMKRKDNAEWGVCVAQENGRKMAGIVAAGRPQIKGDGAIFCGREPTIARWSFV